MPFNAEVITSWRTFGGKSVERRYNLTALPDATTLTGLMGSYEDAGVLAFPLTLANHRKTVVQIELSASADSIPANENALAGVQLVLSGKDTGSNPVSFSLPAAEMANIVVVPGTNTVDITDTAVADFITYLENEHVSSHGLTFTITKGEIQTSRS